MCPADGVVVVRSRRAEVVDVLGHELRRLEFVGAIEHDHLVEGASERALRRRAVVTDQAEDQGVVEDTERLERVEQTADVVVGVVGLSKTVLNPQTRYAIGDLVDYQIEISLPATASLDTGSALSATPT